MFSANIKIGSITDIIIFLHSAQTVLPMRLCDIMVNADNYMLAVVTCHKTCHVFQNIMDN